MMECVSEFSLKRWRCHASYLSPCTSDLVLDCSSPTHQKCCHHTATVPLKATSGLNAMTTEADFTSLPCNKCGQIGALNLNAADWGHDLETDAAYWFRSFYQATNWPRLGRSRRTHRPLRTSVRPLRTRRSVCGIDKSLQRGKVEENKTYYMRDWLPCLCSFGH